MLSIVIPTFNAGDHLRTLLSALAEFRDLVPCEVIVVDGGSTDATFVVASQGEAIFLQAPRGRGRQLAAGAEAAAGDWLLFLHADTQFLPGWTDAVLRFMGERGADDCAGYFRFALDDEARAARMIERIVAWRCRVVSLPFGDQGLLIGRAFYDKLGGYKRIPLMEDVDLVRRIGRRRLFQLPATAVTSSEAYRRDGYLLRPLRNILLLSLYRVGLPPRYLSSIYR